MRSVLDRRRFLTAGLGASFAIPGNKAWGGTLGANETVRVGIVGLNGRGQSHMELVTRTPGFRLAALCDVDPTVLGRSVERTEKKGIRVQTFKDVRDLIGSKDIDAITIALPNHWHALVAIWACQAGKDVYVEKPVSHNVWEGRQLVNAACKYQRMVQGGMQARSNPDLIEAVAWIRAGHLKDPVCPGLLLQGPHSDRQGGHGRDPTWPGLRPVDRTGPTETYPTAAIPLRLALDLRLRQRRPGEPGRQRDADCSVVSRLHQPVAAGSEHWRPSGL